MPLLPRTLHTATPTITRSAIHLSTYAVQPTDGKSGDSDPNIKHYSFVIKARIELSCAHLSYKKKKKKTKVRAHCEQQEIKFSPPVSLRGTKLFPNVAEMSVSRLRHRNPLRRSPPSASNPMSHGGRHAMFQEHPHVEESLEPLLPPSLSLSPYIIHVQQPKL